MAATLTNKYYSDVMQGVHKTTDEYCIALFPSTATLDARTTTFNIDTGVAATGGANQTGIISSGSGAFITGKTTFAQSTAGIPVKLVTLAYGTVGGTATDGSDYCTYMDWADPEWTGVTFSGMDRAVIFNNSVSGSLKPVLAVLNFTACQINAGIFVLKLSDPVGGGGTIRLGRL